MSSHVASLPTFLGANCQLPDLKAQSPRSVPETSGTHGQIYVVFFLRHLLAGIQWQGHEVEDWQAPHVEPKTQRNVIGAKWQNQRNELADVLPA